MARPLPRPRSITGQEYAAIGAVILLTTIGFYSVSATLPMVLSVLVGLGLVARHGKAYVAQLRQSFADEKPQSG